MPYALIYAVMLWRQRELTRRPNNATHPCYSCTHIFCRNCLLKALELKTECPLDHTPLTVEEVRDAG